MRRLFVMALTAPAVLLASNVWAASTVGEPLDHPVPSVRVHYDDLDIKEETGARELMSRITYAARKACGPQPEATEFHMMDKWDGCVKEAFERAVKSVDAPVLYLVAGMRDPQSRTSVAKAN